MFTPEQTEYLYPTTIDIIVSLESAGNARVEIWVGEESDPEIPTFDIMIAGEWVSDLIVPYTFKFPGEHLIYINCSNSINFITTDSQFINIETPVETLNAGLAQEPVIYLLAGFGEAEFKFFFDDIGRSGI